MPAKPPPVKLLATAGDQGRAINPAQSVGVDVEHGVLSNVTLTGHDGKKVAGELASNKRNWTATEPLEYGQTYTWSGNARGADGNITPVTGSFNTVKPAKKVHGTLNVTDAESFGIGMPIIISFDSHIANKAAVEKQLSLHTSTPTEGSWAWLPDTSEGSRVHWRPRDYWQPHTKVTVSAALFGLDLGDGAYGDENVSANFDIGRAQITKADVSSHRLVVMRDGQQAASYPASYGMDSDPRRSTHSGIHVVNGLSQAERMVSREFGYDQVEYWATRMSNNGEFIHANPGTVGSQGSTNVSHGCVNLSTANAREYFQGTLLGDPVEVTNSGVPLGEDDGDIYDWTIPWEKWQTMSALHQAPAATPPAQHMPG